MTNRPGKEDPHLRMVEPMNAQSPSTETPPPFWRRALATFIDLSLIAAVLGLLQFVLTWLTGGHLQAALFSRGDKWLSYAYVLLTVSWLPFNLYFSLLESSRWQATLGKRRLGLRVTDMGGNRLSFGRAVVRTTLKFLPWELGHVSVILLADLTVTGLAQGEGFPFTPATRFTLKETVWTTPVRLLAFGLLGIYILGALRQRQRRGLYDLLAGSVVRKV